MSNTNAPARKQKFSVAIQTDVYKNLIYRTLGDPKKGDKFIANLTSAVSVNPTLQECEPGTIISGGLLGNALNLSPSPQLGQYYFVPFNDTKKKSKVAQFILGYKGYLQLALRSGCYKHINVLEIKEGELIKYDPFNEIFEASYIEDENRRENTPTIGYYAMFECLNGFRKVLYWSKSKMENYAITYSKGYSAKNGYTFWEKNFDEMAKKTMLRQLISKWGIMSIDMTEAYTSDGAIINTDGSHEYVTNSDEIIDQSAAPPEANVHPMQEGKPVIAENKQVKLSDI